MRITVRKLNAHFAVVMQTNEFRLEITVQSVNRSISLQNIHIEDAVEDPTSS